MSAGAVVHQRPHCRRAAASGAPRERLPHVGRTQQARRPCALERRVEAGGLKDAGEIDERARRSRHRQARAAGGRPRGPARGPDGRAGPGATCAPLRTITSITGGRVVDHLPQPRSRLHDSGATAGRRRAAPRPAVRAPSVRRGRRGRHRGAPGAVARDRPGDRSRRGSARRPRSCAYEIDAVLPAREPCDRPVRPASARMTVLRCGHARPARDRSSPGRYIGTRTRWRERGAQIFGVTSMPGPEARRRAVHSPPRPGRRARPVASGAHARSARHRAGAPPPGARAALRPARRPARAPPAGQGLAPRPRAARAPVRARAPPEGDQRRRRPARARSPRARAAGACRATRSRSAPRPRARRAPRRAGAPTRPSSAPRAARRRPRQARPVRLARARPLGRAPLRALPVATRSGASARSPASTSPATATTSSSGRA